MMMAGSDIIKDECKKPEDCGEAADQYCGYHCMEGKCAMYCEEGEQMGCVTSKDCPGEEQCHCEPHSKVELNYDQPPDFCTSEWCYVNKSACTTAAYEPSAFYDDGVFYSYETCNSTDKFTKGYENGAFKELVHSTYAGPISEPGRGQRCGSNSLT